MSDEKPFCIFYSISFGFIILTGCFCPNFGYFLACVDELGFKALPATIFIINPKKKKSTYNSNLFEFFKFLNKFGLLFGTIFEILKNFQVKLRITITQVTEWFATIISKNISTIYCNLQFIKKIETRASNEIDDLMHTPDLAIQIANGQLSN